MTVNLFDYDALFKSQVQIFNAERVWFKARCKNNEEWLGKIETKIRDCSIAIRQIQVDIDKSNTEGVLKQEIRANLVDYYNQCQDLLLEIDQARRENNLNLKTN